MELPERKDAFTAADEGEVSEQAFRPSRNCPLAQLRVAEASSLGNSLEEYLR